MLFFKKWFNSGKSSVVWEQADRGFEDVSRGLTPEKVDAIMSAANSGDTARQCRLCNEILEKNHDVMQAFSTRRNAVLGSPRSIVPGDGSPEAKRAAETLSLQLEATGVENSLDSFEDLLEDMMGALLPGFAVSELVWRNGGELAGFRHIPQHNFTFRDGVEPRLITRDAPLGITLPAERIICHKLRMHGSDPVRGGLIRPLAWLHCFGNLHFKDLLSFIERYGMPFVFVKVDSGSFERERNTIKRLIRNFGSNGGGLFTKNVEAQLLQASGSNGEVYFRLLEYCEAAVCKVLLGQTASSGDSSGLSRGDAQSKVRQDILEADCRWIERSVNTRIFQPWCRYNFGADVAAPRLSIDCTPPEDKAVLAGMIQSLASAGFEAESAEISERFGIRLKKAENTHAE